MRLYAGHVNKWFEIYSSSQGANYCAIHSLLYLRTIQEKYIKMYERFVNQLKGYSWEIRVLSKGYLPILLLPPSKLAKILHKVKQVLSKTNKNYGLVLKGMYKYYDMKLVAFWHRPRQKFDNTISHFCTAIYTETTDSVSDWDNSSSNTRYE